MVTSEDPIKRAQDFETAFLSWFNSATGYKGKIDDSRQRVRMILPDAKERRDRDLSALPSTKSTEVVDKAKEAALVEYHKDIKSIGYTATSTQDPNTTNLARWLTATVHYRMNAVDGFPFFAWHESSLKTGYTDGVEAAMAYWKKEAWKDNKTVYRDEFRGVEISEADYKLIKFRWPDIKFADPTLPEFDVLYTKQTVTEEVVCKDTWWIRQLLPGENVFWDFKAPFLNPNAGQACLVKLPMTVDEVLDYSAKGVFDKVKREEVEQYLTLEGTTGPNTDRTASALTKNTDLGDLNNVEVWIFWEKIGFRWMVSFSLEGKKALTKKPKPSDDVFFNGRRVNVLPVVIGYFDKELNENIGRSLPQAIAPIEDQYIDHINNINDISKNIARGGRIRISPSTDVDIDQVMNAGAFYADEGEVEFIQYNPGIMESLRASDMHAAAINSIAPIGVSQVNIAPKGTTKTLGQSQLLQGSADAKRYVQLMVRNQTFFKPLLWVIAQLEFAYETNEKALRIAASQVPGFQLPIVMGSDGKEMIDVSVLDFDVDVQINAGLGEMPDVQKFNNLAQFEAFCKQIGIMLDPMMLGQMAASWAGYAFDRFNPQPPSNPEPKPKLDSKLTVAANWIDLPPEIQMMLFEKWQAGQVATDTKIDARMNELMHNGNPQPAAQNMRDMTQGNSAVAMSQGGQIGGAGGY